MSGHYKNYFLNNFYYFPSFCRPLSAGPAGIPGGHFWSHGGGTLLNLASLIMVRFSFCNFSVVKNFVLSNFQRISDGFAVAHARRALETGAEVVDKGPKGPKLIEF